MEKNIFYGEIKDILEIEDDVIHEETEIQLTSLSTLSIMAFIDENFEKQVKPTDLQKVTSVRNLMDLIGRENFV